MLQLFFIVILTNNVIHYNSLLMQMCVVVEVMHMLAERNLYFGRQNYVIAYHDIYSSHLFIYETGIVHIVHVY